MAIMPTNPIKNMRDAALEKLNLAKSAHEKAMSVAHTASEVLAAAKASYDAYEEAYQAVEGTVKPKRKRSPRTPSGASEDTKTLFSALHAGFVDKDFGYDDIANYAEQCGIVLNMTNMRSNASDYVRHGYLDRPVNGRFIITNSGKKFFGIPDKNPPKQQFTPHSPQSMPGLDEGYDRRRFRGGELRRDTNTDDL